MLSVTTAWQTRIVWFPGLLGMPERNSTERNNFLTLPYLIVGSGRDVNLQFSGKISSTSITPTIR